MRTRQRNFVQSELTRLRGIPLSVALTHLGLYWKVDPDFTPDKSNETQRFHVTIDGRVFELIVTGIKWYDTRAAVGGGGAIDLVKYLLRVDFVHAVQLLVCPSTTQR